MVSAAAIADELSSQESSREEAKAHPTTTKANY